LKRQAQKINRRPSLTTQSYTPVRFADEPAIAHAAQALRDGQLVAFPTETVYGLGADATNSLAVAKIFAAKGRPQFNPLIVHFASTDAARDHVHFSDAALKLAGSFWPGPLTLVLPRKSNRISDLVSAGLPTIAVRVPDHPVAKHLLQQAGVPVAAPSANRSGHVSATTPAHVAADLGQCVTIILNGGATHHGVESTIVDARNDSITLLRPGAVTREQLEAVLGHTIENRSTRDAGEYPTAPGQLASHYAPLAKLRLNATNVEPTEALIAFGRPLDHNGITVQLSETGDLIEAAAQLFACLRELDARGVERAAVMAIPNTGVGVAINDRLQRAAAPRG
jgi:L-threonylcarbamoyladenylate synthase